MWHIRSCVFKTNVYCDSKVLRTFLAQKLSSLLTSWSSSEWQNGRKYTISLIRPRNSSLRKWACGGTKEWTTEASPANYSQLLQTVKLQHLCVCVCVTFRIGRITDSLNCREILMSSPFCTSAVEKHNININLTFGFGSMRHQIALIESLCERVCIG